MAIIGVHALAKAAMLAALKSGCAANGGIARWILAMWALHGSRAACRKRQQAAAVQGGGCREFF